MTPEREQALPDFEDSDVQIVYGILCDTNLAPPAGDHWEGFSARHIVAQLRVASEAEKDRMRQALEYAPHSTTCKSRAVINDEPGFDDPVCRSINGCGHCERCEYRKTRPPLRHFPCNCWKSEALAGTTPQPCTACAAKQKQFDEHTKSVADFLNDIYAILVDPLADGVRPVKETCDAIRAAAERSRNELYMSADKQGEIDRLREALALARDHWQGYQADCGIYESDLKAIQVAYEAMRSHRNGGVNVTIDMENHQRLYGAIEDSSQQTAALSVSPADPKPKCETCDDKKIICTALAPCPRCSVPVESAQAEPKCAAPGTAEKPPYYTVTESGRVEADTSQAIYGTKGTAEKEGKCPVHYLPLREDGNCPRCEYEAEEDNALMPGGFND